MAVLGGVGLLAACQGQQYDVDLTMTPSSAGACDVPVAVDIRWDASRLGLQEAYLEFGSLGGPARLWYMGASKGAKRTEAWVSDGTTVTLKARNGVVLAKRTFTTTVCPGKEWL
jgi:hypothetical protein